MNTQMHKGCRAREKERERERSGVDLPGTIQQLFPSQPHTRGTTCSVYILLCIDVDVHGSAHAPPGFETCSLMG